MIDDVDNVDSLLDGLEDEWRGRQAAAGRDTPPAGKKRIDRPVVERSAVRGASVTTARRAGAFNRKTIDVQPELEQRIVAAAEQEGVGLMAFYRFLLAEGWAAYESGRAVPQPAAPVVHRLKSDDV